MSEKKGQVQDLRGRKVPCWWGEGGKGQGKGKGPGRWRKKELLENEDSGMIPDFQLEDLHEWRCC